MLLKFLFGTNRVIPADSEDKGDDIKLKDCLMLTVKKDVFQHSDMKRILQMSASHGGFVKRIRKPDMAYFYGESISCRVSTDDSMMELYTPLLEKGSIWHVDVKTGYATHAVFVVCPEGYKPTSILTDIEWNSVDYAGMLDILKGEDSAGYDF